MVEGAGGIEGGWIGVTVAEAGGRRGGSAVCEGIGCGREANCFKESEPPCCIRGGRRGEGLGSEIWEDCIWGGFKGDTGVVALFGEI